MLSTKLDFGVPFDSEDIAALAQGEGSLMQWPDERRCRPTRLGKMRK